MPHEEDEDDAPPVDAPGPLASSTAATHRLTPPDDRPEVGTWWWVQSRGTRRDPASYDLPGRRWLGCVVEVGSNYARLRGVRLGRRIALDEFHQRCAPEPTPGDFIAAKIGQHRDRVRALMEEIRQTCHRLGVPLRKSLSPAAESSQALAVAHAISDVRAYGDALVLARDTTLPALLNQVRAEHEQMATWMRAELIPAQAELAAVSQATEVISSKVQIVELYAGLQETLAMVRSGPPAPLDAAVHLMQRRHYMDEECLARYQAGGMDFQDLAAFDAWIAQDEHLYRLLPHPRCIVAFRIRRNDKEYKELHPFIRLRFNTENTQTFLYIRNGEQLWRLSTAVDFGERLFPRREDEDLLGDDELWIRPDESAIEHGDGVITGRQRAALIERHRAQRSQAARELWQWHRAGKPSGAWRYEVQAYDDLYAWDPQYNRRRLAAGETVGRHGRPHLDWDLRRQPDEGYQRLTPDSIYYDDVARRVSRAAADHNRVAVVVQGLLDRSTCLHPHPPWQIWTPAGFESGVQLVYDTSRAIAPGVAPDFEAYRRSLNEHLRSGCHTIGQRDAWVRDMEDRHGDRWRGHVRGDPGPDLIHRVEHVRRSGVCRYRWTRDRVRPRWVSDPDRPGYQKAIFPTIPVRWECSTNDVTCVDAYQPGDFRQFFDDPRTRADYLQWAPVLLACEDWHHRRAQAGGAQPSGGADDRGDPREDEET